MYKCEICGKEYESIKDRIQCEAKCLAKQEKEGQSKQLEKWNAELQAKNSEIQSARETLNKLEKERAEIISNRPYTGHVYTIKNGNINSDIFDRIFDNLTNFIF